MNDHNLRKLLDRHIITFICMDIFEIDQWILSGFHKTYLEEDISFYLSSEHSLNN